MANGNSNDRSSDKKAPHLWLPPEGYRYDSTASIKTGLAIVVSVAVLLSMLMSVVAWGLKLEGEFNVQEERVIHLEKEIAVLEAEHIMGIHNVAKAEIDALKKRVAQLEGNE